MGRYYAKFITYFNNQDSAAGLPSTKFVADWTVNKGSGEGFCRAILAGEKTVDATRGSLGIVRAEAFRPSFDLLRRLHIVTRPVFRL